MANHCRHWQLNVMILDFWVGLGLLQKSFPCAETSVHQTPQNEPANNTHNDHSTAAVS
jgi:hypothetical protein